MQCTNTGRRPPFTPRCAPPPQQHVNWHNWFQYLRGHVLALLVSLLGHCTSVVAQPSHRVVILYLVGFTNVNICTFGNMTFPRTRITAPPSQHDSWCHCPRFSGQGRDNIIGNATWKTGQLIIYPEVVVVCFLFSLWTSPWRPWLGPDPPTAVKGSWRWVKYT